MASRADVERLRRANNEIVRLARADLDRFWAAFADRPAIGRQALVQYMPVLTRKYGNLASSVAAQWYDELRAKAGAPGRLQALPAPGVPDAVVQGTTRWATNPIDVGDVAGARTRVSYVLSRYVLQPGRDTITSNASREHALWARVPTGAETCAFCLMLASRGFAYTSQHTATHSRDGRVYHPDCDCVPVPDWSDDPRVEGYDPDDLYARYQAARQDAGSGSLTAILASLRQLEGIS